MSSNPSKNDYPRPADMARETPEKRMFLVIFFVQPSQSHFGLILRKSDLFRNSNRAISIAPFTEGNKLEVVYQPWNGNWLRVMPQVEKEICTMSGESDSFGPVIHGIKKGEDPFQTRFYEQWKMHVLSIAKNNLDPGLGAKVSPDSILQSVMRSVLMGIQGGDFDYIENWAMVNSLLARVTVRKCLNKNRKFHTKKREEPKRLDWAVLEREIAAEEIELAASSPSGDLEEEFHQRLKPIRMALSEKEQQVLEMLLTGNTNKEIAQKCQYSVRTIERLKKKIGSLIIQSIKNSNEIE